jgi:hypothetical protein
MKNLVTIFSTSLWMAIFILKPEISEALFKSIPDSVQIVFNEKQLRLPGESFQIGIIAWYKNGKIKKTTGYSGGSVFWWRYKVEVTGGNFSSGKITVNERLIPSRGKYILIRAYPKKQPQLVKELLLPLNYETEIKFQPTNEFDKSPGSRIKGNLTARFDNGTERVYEDLDSKKASDYYEFLAYGGTWNRGQFIIEPDFTRIVDHHSDLLINSLRNRLVSDTFSVLLDYKHGYRLSFTGISGSNGFHGRDGRNGSPGENGEYGYPGQDGEPGQDGPDIGVWADLYRDSLLNTDLLYVFTQNLWTGQENRYLINPMGGSLTVITRGGDGGFGGTGGDGGDGGNGREGRKWIEKHKEKKTEKKPVVKKVIKKETKKITDPDGKEREVEVEVEKEETVLEEVVVWVEVSEEKQGPGENGGNGGWGGPGGLGGPGGYGGNISLYFTEDAMPYKQSIISTSKGGSGGMHGSGGHGGHGGQGGEGHPDGRHGFTGHEGPSVIGSEENGYPGKITIGSTEEFFFYRPVETDSIK